MAATTRICLRCDICQYIIPRREVVSRILKKKYRLTAFRQDRYYVVSSGMRVLDKSSRARRLKDLPKSSVNLSCNSSREENSGEFVFLCDCARVLKATGRSIFKNPKLARKANHRLRLIRNTRTRDFTVQPIDRLLDQEKETWRDARDYLAVVPSTWS